MLFGEWCYAKHSIHYTRLPDWLIAFDVYDLAAHRFWSVPRLDVFVGALDLAAVPRVAQEASIFPTSVPCSGRAASPMALQRGCTSGRIAATIWSDGRNS